MTHVDEHLDEYENGPTVCGYDGCDSVIRRRKNLYQHLTDPRGPHQLEPRQALRVEARHRTAFEFSYLRSKAPERAKDWTLDTFPADDVAGRRALKAARTWIEGDAQFHPRLYIHGKPGGGKTGLAYGIARKWLSYGDTRVEFENMRALLERQRARISRRQGKALDHLLIEDWEAHGLLVVLDDVGADRPTEFAVDTTALIIEHLHALDVPLIVTTNYAPSELGKRLGRVHPVEGARIVSRLREAGTVIPLNRADQRMRSAA
jgi:DNA replication protein DnaC